MSLVGCNSLRTKIRHPSGCLFYFEVKTLLNSRQQLKINAMTKQSLRIYVYRITFEEVLHYYYGSHKEKRFDEYYMGSPVTHKDFWELYTPKKEYIKFFEFSDEGYTEARIFEDSLIAPVLNDEFCLNENCGGSLSLKTYRKGGKIGGNKTKENKTGIFGLYLQAVRAGKSPNYRGIIKVVPL
jgi:hypothetical protein